MLKCRQANIIGPEWLCLTVFGMSMYRHNAQDDGAGNSRSRVRYRLHG